MKKYKLDTIENEHIHLIRKWRNEQINVLRQARLINKIEQEEYFSKIHLDDRQMLFSILEDGQLVGYCGLVNINYINGTCELSFICNTEIINTPKYDKILLFTFAELAKNAFMSLGLNRIWTETYDFRRHHLNLLEEFGMIKEGILREQIFYNGERHDSIVHSMLRREYDRK
tara:strand:+ start:1074 stop:1589 length:516 start_codon:yes stop_codon:yes gene_type:complete